MVVLAASIITRSGKAILSRQFRDLTKNRVTELLANFPSLLSDNNTQHTTVEDEHVRYVYQPLDELYIILITNRQSNILQDIDTLNTFAETINSLLRVVNEQEIFENAFEILSAFDEIITLGYKENVSLLQIKTFLEMDSHEEKIQEIIERNKELEATEERKRRAIEIKQKELNRLNNIGSVSGFGGNSPYGAGPSSPSFGNYPSQTQTQPQQSYAPTPVEPTISKARTAPKGRGLQLGKKPKSTTNSNQDQSSEPLIATPEPRIVSSTTPSYHDSPRQVQSPIPQEQDDRPENNGILITLEEKITAEITREGSIQSSELKGVLQLRINDSELAHSKILLQADGASDGVQYKTHPNVDRALFAKESIIGLKDPAKPFPSNDQNLGVLRWRGVGKSDENKFIPIQFSTWVSENGSLLDVTLEFEVTETYNEEVNKITILVPVATENVELKSDNASIIEISEEGIFFEIEKLSPGENGVLEFSIEANEDILFPIEVSFVNENPVNSLGKVKVLDVVKVEDDESLSFDQLSELSTEGYFIV
ncbi:Coatomer subunit delta-2 [Wickerhamomyces ciferrii]|uniref:Coatomer subunit delta n=1 Tax=Wickerhamomyces ciferrii (strain ATCC 14091 / BCRC 22168 / CBS 111 / JCM 3599 / NBRC 0793 / NRRL Y-1031 F-60-10) TaxID=1206466 RepID=K0KQC3_WICCF|nr:Coatomer subunit delta-2 [Wickerhamomyces ciferrii]CCH43599.1 Coatomer subunit delta-2 [Wickerhamomyces ciferrii]